MKICTQIAPAFGVTKSNSCTKSSTRIQMQEQWKATN